MMTSLAPDGFVRFDDLAGNAYMEMVGPLFMRVDPERGPLFGFRVEQRHCNAIGICHGGMIATFADIYLPTQLRFDPEFDDGYTPTISLTLDFLGMARIGSWVEGSGRLLRRTGRMIFTEGLVTADGEPVLRASGAFRRGKPGERIDTNQHLQSLVGTWPTPPLSGPGASVRRQ